MEVPEDGKLVKKLKRRAIIDMDEKHAEKMSSFKIGHNSASSETFLPNFVFDENMGTVYVDLAGLNDTSGKFIKLINWMICK